MSKLARFALGLWVLFATILMLALTQRVMPEAVVAASLPVCAFFFLSVITWASIWAGDA